MTEAELIRLCREGQKLCKTLWTSSRGVPHVDYCLEPSGTHVSELQAFNLLASGRFEPTGDGLPELENSQTWKLK